MRLRGILEDMFEKISENAIAIRRPPVYNKTISEGICPSKYHF